MVKISLSRFGIPEEFHSLEWDDLSKFDEEILSKEEQEVYAKIYEFSIRWAKYIIRDKNKMGLFLCGANGSGKTALGCLLLKGFLIKGKSGLRVTLIKMQQAFFSAWKIPDVALQRGVLFLDEVGKEYTTKQGHDEYLLEYILKYRSERQLPTILCANADIEYLSNRYGETVNSILRGRYIPLNFPEIDLRRRMAIKNIEGVLGYADAE